MSSNSLYLAVLLAAALPGLAAGASAQSPPAGVKELTRQAPFVFRGTVVEVHAANLKVVVPDASTAVVRVDEVLRAPLTLDRFDGRSVTVFVDKAHPVTAGQSLTFFTRIGLYGESLGVVELGRSAADTKALRTEVAQAGREVREEDVLARVERAGLAVSGRVVAVRPVAPGRAERRDSEHDPEWGEAEIEVDSVLQGVATGARVTVLYPRSFDVMWAGSPKPRLGQEGIFLLHRDQYPGLDAWTALRPQDLLNREEAEIAKKGTRS